MSWALLLFALGPGLYAGATEAGRVDLELRTDGSAVFGGAELRWSLEGDTLRLGEARYAVRETSRGVVIEGPLGRVWLRPLPAAPPPTVAAAPPPLDPRWAGAWRHVASGGWLLLRLDGDGEFVMEQRVLGDDTPQVTRGRWRANAEGFTLESAGGPPLRYRARRAGEKLLVSGGDLPLEVVFEPAR